MPRARFLFGSSFPVLTNRALQEFGQMYSGGRPQKDPKPLPPLSRTYPQNLGLLPNYGGYVPGKDSPRGDWNICVCVWNGWKWLGRVGIDMGGGVLGSCTLAFSLCKKGNGDSSQWEVVTGF